MWTFFHNFFKNRSKGAGDFLWEVTTKDESILETVPQGWSSNTFSFSLKLLFYFLLCCFSFSVGLFVKNMGLSDKIVLCIFYQIQGSGNFPLSSTKLAEAVKISGMINFQQLLGIYVVV